MSRASFSDGYKRDAVAQIAARGYSVAEVSKRLGVSAHSLYEWKRKLGTAQGPGEDYKDIEIRRLKRELVRVTEERDILKNHRVFRQGCKVKYAFVAEHRPLFPVRTMCRCLRIHPSGFYAWLKNPLSNRAGEGALQTALIRKAWQDSGQVYGYRKLTMIYWIWARHAARTALHVWPGWQASRPRSAISRRPGSRGGKPSIVFDNTLDRQFDVATPDTVWVMTDITYIRTLEGFVHLAVVIDLYSRRVVGWALQSRQTTEMVLQALLMAVWRRKPDNKVRGSTQIRAPSSPAWHGPSS